MVANPNTHAAAGKLSQLLGEVIIHHAPWTSQIAEETKRRLTDEWLERLESHSSTIVGPLIEKVLEETNPPEEIRHIIAEMATPSAQYGSLPQQFLIYGIGFSLAGTLTQPFLVEVSNQLSSAAVKLGISRPLSPADLAVGAVRGIAPGGDPIVKVPAGLFDIAAESQISAEDMQFLADIAGSPPSPQELLEMFRRKLIPLGEVDGGGLTVASGLQEGDTRDEWISIYQKLAFAWLTPLDFVRAVVQAQVDPAVGEEWAAATGLDTTTMIDGLTPPEGLAPSMFGLAVSIAGRPPGPEEAGRMMLRGIIPAEGTGADATTFQQAIAESDVKTKWTNALRALQEYLPPPRMVTNLLKSAAITAAQAKQLWEMSGVPSELADAYVFQATHEATEQEKNLAKGDVLNAYADFIIDKQVALESLDLLGYSGQVADTMIAVVDFRRELKAMNAEVTRIGSYYTHFKISETVAEEALTTLGVPSEQIKGLLSVWGIDRTIPNRIPSTADIGKAVKYGTLTTDQGIQRLEELGFTSLDAAIVLSADAEVAITPLPEQTPPAVNV